MDRFRFRVGTCHLGVGYEREFVVEELYRVRETFAKGPALGGPVGSFIAC